MPDINTLSIFVTAAIIMLITPGPAVLYIVAQSIEQGRVAGIISALGIALGGLVHMLFAAFGLSIILVQSAVAFSTVKYMGAVYLIYLGIMKFIKKENFPDNAKIEKKKLGRIFTQGIIVNLFNPKTALFFLAFLPQFVNPSYGSVIRQVMSLGMIFICLAILSDGTYALIAGSARNLFSSRKIVNKMHTHIPGIIYLILGITTLFVKNGNK